MTDYFDAATEKSPKFSTLNELLRYRAQFSSEQTAYTFLQDGETETSSLTYQELDRQARKLAAKLISMNATNSRALLLYPPGLDFITAFFGCLYAGVIAVPAYPPRPNQSIGRLQTIITDAQATIALTTSLGFSNIQKRFTDNSELSSLQWLTTDDLADDAAIDWQEPSASSDTLAFLQYTSGSTGTPKGVMISHGNILHNCDLIHQSFADTPKSLGVSWLPSYHDMGLIGGVLQPLYIGAPIVLMPALAFIQKPVRWLQAISHYKATTSGGPNFAYDLCLRKITPEQRATLDLSSWEVAFTGAEPVRAQTLEQFVDIFASCGFRKESFHPCYGMAETTLLVSGGVKMEPPVMRQVSRLGLETNRVIAVSSEQEDAWTVVGCGQSWLDQKILIVDPDSLSSLPANEVGEIWVSSPSVAQGYWHKPMETERDFHAHLATTGEGPFLRTGDLGFLQAGELFITGRIKDLLIVRGQNHYPQDIELTVEQSHLALKPGCGAAFTVDIKNEERLVVVQEVERNYLRKLDVGEVVKSIHQAVTAQHSLQIYAAVLVKTGSIPKTSSGKIQRHACRSGFLAGSLNVIEDWSENPQGKAKFINLQTEVDSLLRELSTGK